MFETIHWSVDGRLGVARLDREHGNAINAELVRDLDRVCAEAGADDGVDGVLLTAAGKLFCPGLDLQELIRLERDEMAQFVKEFTRSVTSLYALPKPVVAAIQGPAVAGGCVLALTADWRCLRRGAIVGLNEVRVGVPLPFGVAMIVRESVPALFLEEIALLGKNYPDEEALRAGLVHEIHASEGFEDHCLARLEEFASRDPRALQTTKRYLRSAVVERITAHEEMLIPEFLDSWYRDETRERIGQVVESLRSR